MRPAHALLLLLVGCGASHVVATPSALSPLEPARLEEVQAYSPELAGLVLRLRGASEDESAMGREASAERLARLADIALLGSLELCARSEAAEREATLLRELSAAQPDAPVTVEPPPPEPAPPPRRRARPRPREAAVDTPSPDEDAGTEEPDTLTDTVRGRLASLATRLSEVQTTETNRVEFDSVQSTLIEADRALSEGLTARASQLADAAQRQLANLTGESAPVAPPPEPAGVLSDARREMGDRALVRGRLVAVRLDPVVRWRDGAWQARQGQALDQLRALARTYRETQLVLVTVGEPGDESLVEHADALAVFLHQRLQIARHRLSVQDQVGVRLPPGTYVAIRAGTAE